MNINKFLTAAVLRLLNDTPENNNNNEETLEELMDDFRIIKGPRKPDNTDECITVHVLTAPQDPDTKQIDGTLQINYYYKNHENGNANIEQLGPVADRIHELFDDKPFDDIDADFGSLKYSGLVQASAWTFRAQAGTLASVTGFGPFGVQADTCASKRIKKSLNPETGLRL